MALGRETPVHMQMRRPMRPWPALVMGMVTMCTVSFAQAAEEKPFYQGKSIDMNIGYTVGGTYDLYARLVARHIGNLLPGKPTVIPKQMVGASTFRVANFMYNSAPKDGTQLAAVDQSLPFQQVLGMEGILFDAREFSWIGNPIADTNTMTAWFSSPVKSIDDAKRLSATVGAVAQNRPDFQIPKALNEMIGTKFQVVTGYPGGNEINLAMERGEVAIRGQNAWSSWKTTHKDWLRDSKITILVQVGLKRNLELNDVPLLHELPSNPEDREALELFSATSELGRPLLSTPNTPKERVQMLRDAFDAMLIDPNFIADAEKSGLDLRPIGGAELQNIVEKMLKSSPGAVARLRQILR